MPDREQACLVSFRYDAPEMSAHAYALDALRATEGGRADLDEYSRGGLVEELETRFARLVGKQSAIFMPTGTLANHLAVRALMRGRSRVLLQHEGHLYNDSGDCLQRLSGLSAVPLGAGRATFELEEVRAAFDKAASARVRAEIGAVVIETPVRRMHGERFDQQEMKEICAFTRERDIGLHLDGARLFLESAYSGIPVQTYASLFDTVYVSLYKYFNAPSGAVLAGPAALIDELYHERRMFGGGLNQAWIFAGMALRSMEGFSERFERAKTASETLKRQLGRAPGFVVSDISMGTNVFRLAPEPSIDPERLRANLWEESVRIPSPEAGFFYLKVNESILALDSQEIADRIVRAAR